MAERVFFAQFWCTVVNILSRLRALQYSAAPILVCFAICSIRSFSNLAVGDTELEPKIAAVANCASKPVVTCVEGNVTRENLLLQAG